jgi:serine/threonine-protein kinase
MTEDRVQAERARFRRVQELFHAAAELAAAERRTWLEAQASGDAALVDDVLSLLEADARADSLLDRDLPDVASRVIEAERMHGTPRELGPYRLQELLGEGGMGVVYLAERADLQSQVAIKVLRDAWLSPSRRERFASEQRTLAQLNHPNIARLYDADTMPDGTPWFAMEFVDGVPLARHCQERGAGVRERLELFRGVCEAVLHAHQRAVIHRDLKPSNILVTHGGQPKLLDFGIAKSIEGLDPRAEWTRAELRLMTPAYAAPEQVRGGAQGVATDVYALGAILYELLAGRPPLDLAGKSATEAATAVCEQPPERPSVAAGGAGASRAEWADLDVLCMKALQKDPERRYPSVESLIRDLDHFKKGEPLEARPDTLSYRTGKFVRRNWRPLGAAAAVVLAVGALVAFYTARLTSARNTAVAESERVERIQTFMNHLFEGGDPAGPSDTLRVVTLLARGVRDARSLAGDPALQADLYGTLGEIYHALGDFERADTLLGAALAARRARAGGDPADAARVLLELGLLRSHQSRFEEADSLVRSGLAATKTRRPADPAAVARATAALGEVLENRGEYDQAIAVLTEAARLDSAARVPASEHVLTLTELANSHFYAGHYDVSDSLNRKILELDRALYGDRHPNVATDLVNLGAVQQEWGRWSEAESYYRQALAIYRGWYGEDHYETAATLNMVGRALVQQSRADDAREPLAQALAIRERVYGPDHPVVASTLNELALLAQKEGRLDDAEKGFQRMQAIYRRAYDGKHYLIGLALSNLGGVYLDEKAPDRAARCFADALEMYGRTLPAGHLYFGITRIKLGRALLHAGRFEDARRESQAGLDIVLAQAEPSERWIEYARTDLARDSVALAEFARRP